MTSGKGAMYLNVAMILSGGVGHRFGAEVPKQYCLLKGRPIIEYAIDACRLSKLADKVIIVAAGKYVKELKKKYGFDTVEGGKERNNSVKNGLDYIASKYDCDKIVMVDAVSPLTTEDQIDKYFKLLDEYDIVQTAQKVTTSLDTYDGHKVMRNDYYHTLEPEAYNFRILYSVFDGDNPSTTVYHQMPADAKKYACFDYPYNMKITYSFDIRIAEILLDDVVLASKNKIVKEKTELWLSSVDSEATKKWMSDVWVWFEELKNRWEIISYHINPQSYTGLVIEAFSRKYGNVIVKFDAPILGRYWGECFYYKTASSSYMAELLDYSDEYNAMLLKQVYPGTQVKFNSDDQKLIAFYSQLKDSFVPINPNEHPELKTIMSNFDEYVELARTHDHELELRSKLERVARNLWKQFFEDSPKVLLHMDLHRRNILDSGECYKAIDCQGVVGPYEFDYTRMFVIDNKDDRENTIDTCIKMYNFCTRFVQKERLLAACFIEWVFLMDEFIFADNDGYSAADWALSTIKTIFYPENEWKREELPIPGSFCGQK